MQPLLPSNANINVIPSEPLPTSRAYQKLKHELKKDFKVDHDRSVSTATNSSDQRSIRPSVKSRFESTITLCQLHSYKYTYNLCLVRRDIERLKAKGWLNDQLVNFLIADVTNTYVETLLGRQDELFIIPSPAYSGYVASSPSRLTLTVPATSRNIFTYDFIAAPINVGNNHWILVLLCHIPQLNPDFVGDPQSSIIILDSLGEKYPHVVTRLKNIILKHLPLVANMIWQPSESAVKAMPTYYPSVPQQPNGYDCGLYPAHFLAIFMNDPSRYFRHCSDLECIDNEDTLVWKECDGDKLRHQARQRVKLHMNCYRLVHHRKLAGLHI